MSGIIIHPEVEAAISSASPIVVLESAVLTAGLPNAPWHSEWPTDALHADQQYLLICSRGQRSHAATRALIRRGMRNVWSLSGGLEALELKHRETA